MQLNQAWQFFSMSRAPHAAGDLRLRPMLAHPSLRAQWSHVPGTLCGARHTDRLRACFL